MGAIFLIYCNIFAAGVLERLYIPRVSLCCAVYKMGYYVADLW